MGKRRSDADSRRFFDEFSKIRVSRFRAMGVVDPSRSWARIVMGGKERLLHTAHTRFPNGGGWSFFRCPKCARRAADLYLIEDAPRCVKCCNALNIWHRTQYGFGRGDRRRASDHKLDELIDRVETTEPLRFKPAPPNWWGKASQVYNSRSLVARMQRSMITLRLAQLANQQANRAKAHDVIKTYQPTQAAKQIVDIKPIWRARSAESLEKALDKAQTIILIALKSDDPQTRLNAAKIMMRTKQARDRGL